MPQEVTIALLKNAMHDAIKTQGASYKVPGEQRSKWADGKGRFLIDGFPRKMDQALGFDETVRILSRSVSSLSRLTRSLSIPARSACPALCSSCSAVKELCWSD